MDNIIIAGIIALSLFVLMTIVIIIQLKRIKKLKKSTAQEIEKERQNTQDTILKLTRDAEQKIADEKQKSADALRDQKEAINIERIALSSKSEKELIIDVLIALNGYASRLDHIEKGLGSDDIQKQIENFSEKFEKRMNDVNKNIDQKLSKMNIFSQLDNIESNVDEIKNNLLYDVCNIKDMIEDIHSGNSNSGLSELQSKLYSIESELYWIKSAAEDAKSASEEAKSAVDDLRFSM